jgi:hypothetical protein
MNVLRGKQYYSKEERARGHAGSIVGGVIEAK